MGTIGNALQRVISQVCGKAVRRSGDPDAELRAHALLVYCGFIFVVAGIWAVGYLASGLVVVPALFVACQLALAATVVFLWRGRSLTVASHLVNGVALVSIVAATGVTGGLRLTNVAPFFMLTLVPFFLLGRPGLVWALGALASALAFQFAAWQGVTFPDLVPPEARQLDAFITWFVSAVVILIFAISYEAARARLARRYRRAAEARSTLLANISHEIRTPLHVVLGVNRILADSELNPEQRDMVRTVQQNAEGLVALFDDLLELARVESGGFRLRLQDFDPGRVVDGVAAAVRHLCRGRPIQVGVEVTAGCPRWVRGDVRRLRQLLLNIGTNAAKFTREGRILVRADGGEGATGPQCSFTISDTGIGISAADHERVFESFTRLDDSGSGVREGVGLGLSIARDLVELMNGTITLESAPGAGSDFTVEVPFEPARSAPPRLDQEGGSVSRTVLLVEDQTSGQEVARYILEKAGYRVVAATDGAEGVDLWASTRPDIILMDLQMPGTDGLQATRMIRARERREESGPVPIIAVTGSSAGVELEGCQKAGVTDYLRKPYDLDELYDLIERHLPPMT